MRRGSYVQRQQKGIVGEGLALVGEVCMNWNIYRHKDGRLKVCAIEPVVGRANYQLRVGKYGGIDSHANLDAGKLKLERPDVYNAVNRFLSDPAAAKEMAAIAEAEEDVYGDIALSRRQKLTPGQNWVRGLLMMRLRDLETLASESHHGTWTSGVRMLHDAVFKMPITDSDLQAAVAYITGAEFVNKDLLLQVERDYYDGKYIPKPCQQLSDQLNFIVSNGNDISDLL